jgi:hypothetical protein
MCRSKEEFKDCDVAEFCVDQQPHCPDDIPKPAGSVCTDFNMKTHMDKCDDKGECIGLCMVDEECLDTQDCTEVSFVPTLARVAIDYGFAHQDFCEGGACVHQPIVGCVAMPTPAPVTSCTTSDRYRFDLLQPVRGADVPEMLSVCGFYVLLSATVPDTSVLARDVALTGGRASRFGVRPVTATAGIEAGLHAGTGVTFAFEDRDPTLANGPEPLYAGMLQMELSKVGPKTLIGQFSRRCCCCCIVVSHKHTHTHTHTHNLGVVLGQTYNVTILNAARAEYISSDKKTTVSNGVWMIDKSGKVDAPPAVRSAKASSWSVVHMAGDTDMAPPSIDAITVEKPESFIPSNFRTEPPTPVEESTSIGLIIGIVICALAFVACIAAGVFFIIYKRKQDTVRQFVFFM